MKKYRSVKNASRKQIHIGKSKAHYSMIFCKKHPKHRQSSGVCSVCLTEKLSPLSSSNTGTVTCWIHHRMASLLKGIRFLAACIMRQRGADHEKGFFYRLLHSRRRNKKDSEGLVHEREVQNKIRDRKFSVPRFKFDLLYYKI